MDAQTVDNVGRLGEHLARSPFPTFTAILVCAVAALFGALMGWIWRLLGKIEAVEKARVADGDKHREELKALNQHHTQRLDALHRERREEQVRVAGSLQLMREYLDKKEPRRKQPRRTTQPKPLIAEPPTQAHVPPPKDTP